MIIRYTIMLFLITLLQNIKLFNTQKLLISNVHLEGDTRIGNGTKVFPFASIGTQPQDLKYNNEKNSTIIGNNNIIREYVTINPGTKGGGSQTIIGNNCLFGLMIIVRETCEM